MERRLGQEITVLPLVGYGTPERVRALGRVVLGRVPGRPAATDLDGRQVGRRAVELHRPARRVACAVCRRWSWMTASRSPTAPPESA